MDSMISLTVSYLAEKLKKNKSVKSFFDDFKFTTVTWLRPLFLKEEKSLRIYRVSPVVKSNGNR